MTAHPIDLRSRAFLESLRTEAWAEQERADISPARHNALSQIVESCVTLFSTMPEAETAEFRYEGEPEAKETP